MRTKLFVLLAAMSSLMAVTAKAEVRTVVVDSNNPEATIEIKEGEVGKCVFANLKSANGNSSEYLRNAYIQVEFGGVKTDVQLVYRSAHHPPAAMDFPIVAGPAKVKLIRERNNAILSMEITPNETALSKSAGHALVLPEGEDGKQKLVLESSTDLVNWTEDSLGSKDSSDKKRFYRLRAVKE